MHSENCPCSVRAASTSCYRSLWLARCPDRRSTVNIGRRDVLRSTGMLRMIRASAKSRSRSCTVRRLLLARLCAAAVFTGAVLTGCKAQESTAPTKDNATHFRTEIDGRPIHLALADCEAFIVLPDGRRERVLTTDFYPMISACQRQEASVRDGHVVVELGRQALGAGGCCATEGLWRSRDGMTWERRQSGRWIPAEPSSKPR